MISTIGVMFINISNDCSNNCQKNWFSQCRNNLNLKPYLKLWLRQYSAIVFVNFNQPLKSIAHVFYHPCTAFRNDVS
jgi:hypothetical protein